MALLFAVGLFHSNQARFCCMAVREGRKRRSRLCPLMHPDLHQGAVRQHHVVLGR